MNRNRSLLGIRLAFGVALSLASGCGSSSGQDAFSEGETATRVSPVVGGGPGNVINGLPGANDYVLQVDGLLDQVVAYFPSVTGVTSETDTGTNTADTYSLQINTNKFPTSMCGPSNPTTCQGWQQFVYKASPTQGQLLLVYYLASYSSNPGSNPPNLNSRNESPRCPAAMLPDGIGGCFISITKDVPNPQPTVAQLGDVTMIATVASGLDSVTLSRRNGGVVEVQGNDNLGLGAAWNQAEFNVFGITSGSRANISGSRATISVWLNGRSAPFSQATPKCVQPPEFTGESNSFNLVPGSSCPSGGPAPAITFLETSSANPLTRFCVSNNIWSTLGPMFL